jgi:hypothetical protein
LILFDKQRGAFKRRATVMILAAKHWKCQQAGDGCRFRLCGKLLVLSRAADLVPVRQQRSLKRSVAPFPTFTGTT